MPRKPKNQKTQIIISVNGAPISVTMFPPQGTKRSWYAYWAGLKARKSTGQTAFDQAVIAVNDMLNSGGEKRILADALLSDEEFDEIQRRHYAKKTSPEKRERARKSLVACMEAISAFRATTGLKPITVAAAAECENFQNDALKLPKNWRAKYPKSNTEVENLSANTVLKWSVALQAAFERANDNAGRKCVRGVVPDHKLLKSNPWRRFTWIEGFDKEIRHFNGEELISLLDYFRSHWPGVSVAEMLAKVFLWSWGRKLEIASLKWDDVRSAGSERHFESVGKWGVDKWFRIPQELFDELQAVKMEGPFVFAAFNEQLRQFHASGPRPWLAHRVLPAFVPENLGDWFYNQLVAWSKTQPGGPVCTHIFRKTTLQYARVGEDANRRVAQDARVGEGVMMTSYVKETDEELRQKSNRTFHRIHASLPPEVARRFGYALLLTDPLKQQIAEAMAADNWDLVARLGAELAGRDQQRGSCMTPRFEKF